MSDKLQVKLFLHQKLANLIIVGKLVNDSYHVQGYCVVNKSSQICVDKTILGDS